MGRPGLLDYEDKMSKISGIEARDGKFLYPTNDTYIGRCMAEYGEWKGELVSKLTNIIPEGGVVVEVGSNIGTHTVPIARRLGPNGKVYAFEPQRLIFQLLCANLICNEVYNVFAYNAAVGDRPGEVLVPDLDIGVEENFGAIQVAGNEGLKVELMTIDQLKLDQCDFIKIDAQNFEPQVMLGSFETINKFSPVIYLEYNYHVRSTINFYIKQFLNGYTAWEYIEPIFKENNYFENKTNHYESICSLGLILSKNDIPGVTDSLQVVSI
jgi:FkbM family methyltransferase